MFPCDCCGACCKNLHKSDLYKNLHLGDGICIYLSDNKCSIYDERPLLCRIDEAYNEYFSSAMSKNKYYELNILECEKLKSTQ